MRQRRASAASRSKLVICAARWSTSACASSSRGFAGMSKEQTKPSESLVQELLNERRSLKVAVERLKLELADAQSGSGGPDPHLGELREEIERLRYQLASARAEANQLCDERNGLRRVPLHVRVVLADKQKDDSCDPPEKVGEDDVGLAVAGRGPWLTSHRRRFAGGRWGHLRHGSISSCWMAAAGQIMGGLPRKRHSSGEFGS